MLRLTDGQLRLWDRILPPEATRLSEELARIDKWLSNEELFEPFRKKFRTRTGRPTVPVDTFLRLMYLKYRYNLGYESLVQEAQNGNTHIPNRIVSVFDPDARPIPKGKLKAPTEFGYKVVLGESEERLITDYDVFVRNPSDESLLLDVVDHHKKITDSQLKEVATDRGFTSQDNERELMIRDVVNISLPCRGKTSKTRQEVERQSWFRRLQRWRAGQEATIGLLKSRYGLARSRSRWLPGTKSWVGFGVLAYNLRRLSVIG